MAEGEVNKEDMYDNVWRVFKANERGMGALLKNGKRGMLLCCGWTRFSLCHRKHSSTWAGTTTFLNHILWDCNTALQGRLSPQIPSSWGGCDNLLTERVSLLHREQDEAEPLCLFLLQLTGENMNQKQNQTHWVPKLVVCLCGSPPPFSLSPCESALPDQVHFYLDSSWTTLVRAGASWPIWHGMRSSCLFLDGLSGGNTSEAGGDGIVNLLTTDKKQDENLWKKRINGILKWIVARRGQELKSFMWMAEG